MARYVMCIVMLVVAAAAHRQHCIPESRIKGDYRKVVCSGGISREREKIIEQSKCGEPKDVFVHLVPRVVQEEVHPGAVWVKRCVGLCDYDNGGSCVPNVTIIRHIPVRITNATGKDACAMYPVEEHVSCMCCGLGPESCESPRVYNPRKCACQCPNMEEHRNCLKKRNHNMKWNRSKCTCEHRQRVRLETASKTIGTY